MNEENLTKGEVVVHSELVEVLGVSQLDDTKSQVVLDSFIKFFETAKDYEQKAKAIKVTDVTQIAEMKQAREVRLELKKIRVDAENTRKTLKEQSLREGKAIDGIANVIKALIVPIEGHLELQEKFAEILEEKNKDEVTEQRFKKLSVVADASLYNLRDMSEEAFSELLKSSTTAYEAMLDAEKKAEEARIEQQRLQEEEQVEIRKDNERLKQEAEAREKSLEEEREKVRVEAEAREKLEKDILEKEMVEKEAREKEERQIATEKEDENRLQKEQRYKTFLEENEYNYKTKHLFHIEKVGNEVRLYKIINTFNIK